ncbi:unnamed protein product [Phytomonas sp. Hart1]|nr:unnamed protein product [Phytomonas sp. Hart1]|eukprot:CCW71493.1 unnamed protein product [Phytomonas sp. isolate Hart1]
MAILSTLKNKGTFSSYSFKFLCAFLIFKILLSFLSDKWKKKNRRRYRSHDNKMKRVSWSQIRSLLKICTPRIFSVESGIIFALTILLFLRTRLTLLIARTIGQNGQRLVEKKMKEFMFGVADYALLAIPGTIINVSVFHLKSILQRRFKENLHSALESECFQGNNLYKIATQRTLDNLDHRIHNDASVFCETLGDLFLSVLRPLIDAGILSFNLSKLCSFDALVLLISYYFLVATVTNSITVDFESLIAHSQENEGNLRAKHNQLYQHAEEIAFHNGEELECDHADKILKSIIKHEIRIKEAKWWTGFLYLIFAKYGASCMGYIVSGMVVLNYKDNLSKTELTRIYLQTVQLYIPLSKAIGRLLLLYKKVAAICSSAHRVEELREMLHKISLSNDIRNVNNIIRDDKINEIDLKDVDIVSPNGALLVKNLSLNIVPGRHVLIMGCNGSGKSAIIRVIGELWSLQSGIIKRPAAENIFLLPQRAYLPPGTLRAQMVYPFTEDKAHANNITDSEIMRCTTSLGLTQIVQREGGLNAVKDWHKVLSGGERQRVALVRVLIHCPIFAFLDECTSAIPQSDEVNLYSELQKAGVTLITISHHEALKSLHNVLLNLDGSGTYTIVNLS